MFAIDLASHWGKDMCVLLCVCVRVQEAKLYPFSFFCKKKKKQTFEMRLIACAVQQSRAGLKLVRVLVGAGVKQGHDAVHIFSFFMFLV